MDTTFQPDSSDPAWASRIGRAQELFREVTTLAATALSLSRLQAQEGDADDDSAELQGRMHMLLLLIDRIGWVADVGLRQLGEPGAFARAEDWMLPEA